MIKPTIGRVVWYRPAGRDIVHAAVITHVWSDTCVNLAVFGMDGAPYQRTSVLLVQDNEVPRPGDGYAEWMPYQLGQAAKTAALEEKLGDASEDIRAATESDPALDNLPRG